MIGDKGTATKLMYQVFVALNRKVRERERERKILYYVCFCIFRNEVTLQLSL